MCFFSSLLTRPKTNEEEEEEESVDDASSFQSDSSLFVPTCSFFKVHFFPFFPSVRSQYVVCIVTRESEKNTFHTQSVASQFKRTFQARSHQTHTHTHARSMPVGNLRTAANDEQDDDPRALRPIPIATKDVVSFIEKKNHHVPGHTAEVVSFLFPTSRFDRRRLSNDDDDDDEKSALPSLRLSENGRTEREREKFARHETRFFRLSSSRLSFSLSRARLLFSSIKKSEFESILSRCFVL
jgi:hypothetical protein